MVCFDMVVMIFLGWVVLLSGMFLVVVIILIMFIGNFIFSIVFMVPNMEAAPYIFYFIVFMLGVGFNEIFLVLNVMFFLIRIWGLLFFLLFLYFIMINFVGVVLLVLIDSSVFMFNFFIFFLFIMVVVRFLLDFVRFLVFWVR